MSKRLSPRAARVENASYEDRSLNYSLTLPQGWVRIPDDAVKEFSDSTHQQYVAGFQRQTAWAQKLELPPAQAQPWFNLPYFLIQHQPAVEGSLSDIADEMSKLGSSGIGDTLASRGVVARYGEPVIDEAREMVLVPIHLTQMSKNVRALTALKPGRDGMVLLHLYALSPDFDGYRPAFDEVLNSLRFTEGHSYSSTAIVAHKAVTFLKRAFPYALISALFALLAARRAAQRKKPA